MRRHPTTLEGSTSPGPIERCWSSVGASSESVAPRDQPGRVHLRPPAQASSNRPMNAGKSSGAGATCRPTATVRKRNCPGTTGTRSPVSGFTTTSRLSGRRSQNSRCVHSMKAAETGGRGSSAARSSLINERAMAQQMMEDAVEMMTAAKLENVRGFNNPITPGSVIPATDFSTTPAAISPAPVATGPATSPAPRPPCGRAAPAAPTGASPATKARAARAPRPGARAR